MQELKSFIRNLFPRFVYSWYATLYRKAVAVWFMGNRFECPFCGKHFRKFVAAGSSQPVWREKGILGGLRKNVLCPNCHSADRERMIYIYLRDCTDLLDGTRSYKVLHIAPENNLGRVLREQSHLEYLSGDLNPKRSLNMVRIDITDIQYPENSFDVIICSHVLEHVTSDRKAMAELYRVLKPGGWAILQVPLSVTLKETFEDKSVVIEKDRERVFGQFDHVRIYAKDDYKNRLESVGFNVRVFNLAEELGEKAVRYAFQKDENLYVCSRSL